jgi:hypothetical protein
MPYPHLLSSACATHLYPWMLIDCGLHHACDICCVTCCTGHNRNHAAHLSHNAVQSRQGLKDNGTSAAHMYELACVDTTCQQTENTKSKE